MSAPLAKHEVLTLLNLVRRCLVIYSPTLKLVNKPLVYDRLLYYEKTLELTTVEGFKGFDRRDLCFLLLIVNGAIEEKKLSLSPWHDSVYEDLANLRHKILEILGYRQ